VIVSGQIPADSLKDRVALVTGAGSGIGAASAEALAQAGAKVALVGLIESDLNEVAARIRERGAETLVLEGDVSQEDPMTRAFARMISKWGRLDVVVACAGINGVWAPIEDITLAEWDRTVAVNLRGTFLTLKGALPLLRPNGGSVIIISSVNGSRIFNTIGASAYSSSKAAQIAFAKMAALELAKDRIRVNVICPGSIRTRIDESTVLRNSEKLLHPGSVSRGTIPLTRGNPGSARQVAELVWFLASDLSSHLSGTEVFIDGAESLA
jgi:NAD(P)-dependent dehydrogenase (short-subunit alcohol dehydrogenase family)